MAHLSTKQGVVAVVALIALMAAGCRRVEAPTHDQTDPPKLSQHHVSREGRNPYRRTDPPKLSQHYVTRDGQNTYALKLGPGSMHISAPAHQPAPGNDTRSVMWPPDTKMTENLQSCATWTDQTSTWAIQQGLALRVHRDGGRFRSIVVAKNVMYGAVWQMNVYTWDSARDPYFQIHGAVDLRGAFLRDGRVLPQPWRICAKVEGNLVTIKGWRPPEPVPAWNSTTHAGAVRIPSNWVFSGKAGWYAGHIPAGGTIGMNRLRTSTWDWVPGA